MHPAMSPDVASPDFCRFDQPHCSVIHRRRAYSRPLSDVGHIFERQKRGTNIFRSEGSERCIRKRKRGNSEGGVVIEREAGEVGHERQQKRPRVMEIKQVDLAERLRYSFIKQWCFTPKRTGQVNKNMPFNVSPPSFTNTSNCMMLNIMLQAQ